MERAQQIQLVLSFLDEISLPYRVVSFEEKTFLPGLRHNQGMLEIDMDKLAYPGDILHEAGHYAVCEPKERHLLDGDIYKTGLKHQRPKQQMMGEEMAATAWSVAAAKHLGFSLDIVFHNAGYRGNSKSLISAFEQGGGIGHPLLGAYQMSCKEQGFPNMQTWIRKVSWV
ncbi:hypothetical protein [Pseudoalteromonas luteoviolacea]|uniref:IrrE N-terminal-like domain-containing protein n=1 Tax=Pseudoalteromonas luteoviolacea S4054 TaxID=1129367 RepID=A0A0F6AIF7_9GAMM|nr:hypothetical protein [Pseudoalteromonas luteoviolacea]AOT07275.1 hypothetical protein S4054249_05115 [Pseudoalteromonas luteoviolacea]AOT12190.1 hypothetical protein S40542_05115 [Pseudoalteromonas luteoviolacea]AOT17103.1 hypothetical protein S4054_05115 [Pseudoalteromonas luteoviolacea]KKE85294.1 hypothetical protein N479_04660 [Pseudoalteromonas luteoviolacea S4054]KZN73642.1 hypothetical protein N481_11070 [Pseudoalteromonas luteoviolacea S4047-1]